MKNLKMKSYYLKNKDGEVLVSKAHEIGKGIFIIGRKDDVKKGEINCNTFPITKDTIKSCGLTMHKRIDNNG